MEFIFAEETKTDFSNLYQGDLLVKNAKLYSAIEQSHAY
jgi:hypothetical protein